MFSSDNFNYKYSYSSAGMVIQPLYPPGRSAHKNRTDKRVNVFIGFGARNRYPQFYWKYPQNSQVNLT